MPLGTSSEKRGIKPSVRSSVVLVWSLAGEGDGGSIVTSSSTSVSFCALTRSEWVDRPRGICDPGDTESMGVPDLE